MRLANSAASHTLGVELGDARRNGEDFGGRGGGLVPYVRPGFPPKPAARHCLCREYCPVNRGCRIVVEHQ